VGLALRGDSRPLGVYISQGAGRLPVPAFNGTEVPRLLSHRLRFAGSPEFCAFPAFWTCLLVPNHAMNGVAQGEAEKPMNFSDEFVLFHQTPEQLRRIGKRGGKACARNRRARQRAMPPAGPQTAVPNPPPVETTVQALAALDARFPWLRGAETRSLRILPSASR
jgi:hypothetical protein